MDLTILYWVLIAVMLVGIVGAVIPGIPGPSLILVAVLIWEIATGFADFNLPIIFIMLILALSAGVELLAAYWGAKQVGASKWGQIGAIAGMTLGFFGLLPTLPVGGPLVGILLGAVFGAFLGEFLYRKELLPGERAKFALKVSIAVVVGSLIGNIAEVLLAIAAVALFIFNTWPPVAA
jgi:uncharacterized protein